MNDASPALASPERPDEPSGNAGGGPHRSVIQRLGEAMLAVARRPTRAAYAAWMRVVEPGWVLPLLGALVGLDVLNGAISSAITILIPLSRTSPIHYRFGAPSPGDQLIFALIISPLADLMVVALNVALVAALMPAGQGSLKARAFQVARPYLLAQLVIVLITLLVSRPEFALRQTAAGQNPLVVSLATTLDLAVGIYTLVASLNALAAGSGKSRWLLFAVWLVVSVVCLALVWFVLGALLALIGIHLPVAI